MKEEFRLGLSAATSAMAVGPLPGKALNLSSKALSLRRGRGSAAGAECLPGSQGALREITPGAGSGVPGSAARTHRHLRSSQQRADLLGEAV